jgi:hypothetical protein
MSSHDRNLHFVDQGKEIRLQMQWKVETRMRELLRCTVNPFSGSFIIILLCSEVAVNGV